MLYAAKGLARREGRPLGEVISDLARQARQAPAPDASAHTAASALDGQRAALGLTPYHAPEVKVVTQTQVDGLREAEGL